MQVARVVDPGLDWGVRRPDAVEAPRVPNHADQQLLRSETQRRRKIASRYAVAEYSHIGVEALAVYRIEGCAAFGRELGAKMDFADELLSLPELPVDLKQERVPLVGRHSAFP